MRAYELLNESTADQLLSATDDIIVSAISQGVESIRLAELVTMLHRMGFNATEESILSVVNNSPFVHSAQSGELNIGEKPGLSSTGQDSGEVVDSMADSAVEIR